MNNNEVFDLAFFKNISMDEVSIDKEIVDGDVKLKNIINLINNNKEKFEDIVINSCSNILDFDFTQGSDEDDDMFFEDYFEEYLLKDINREEYQEIVNKYHHDVYEACINNKNPDGCGIIIDESVNKELFIDKMRQVIDYGKLFSDIPITITVSDDFKIEISDDGLFTEPIVIVFDYEMNVTDVWQ